MRGMKSMSLLVAVLLVSSSFAKPPQTPTPLKVEGGLLQGIVEDGLTIYRGIPYAAPNGAGLASWPAYNEAKPQMLNIASGNTKAVPIVSEGGLKVLDKYFAWRRSTEAQPAAVKK